MDDDIKNVNGEIVRGHINTIILKALSEGEKYGYELGKYIEAKCGNGYVLKQPTLYSSLKRLEEKNIITSYWGDENITKGGRRKYFRLSEKGKELNSNNPDDLNILKKIPDNTDIKNNKSDTEIINSETLLNKIGFDYGLSSSVVENITLNKAELKNTHSDINSDISININKSRVPLINIGLENSPLSNNTYIKKADITINNTETEKKPFADIDYDIKKSETSRIEFENKLNLKISKIIENKNEQPNKLEPVLSNNEPITKQFPLFFNKESVPTIINNEQIIDKQIPLVINNELNKQVSVDNMEEKYDLSSGQKTTEEKEIIDIPSRQEQPPFEINNNKKDNEYKSILSKLLSKVNNEEIAEVKISKNNDENSSEDVKYNILKDNDIKNDSGNDINKDEISVSNTKSGNEIKKEINNIRNNFVYNSSRNDLTSDISNDNISNESISIRKETISDSFKNEPASVKNEALSNGFTRKDSIPINNIRSNFIINNKNTAKSKFDEKNNQETEENNLINDKFPDNDEYEEEEENKSYSLLPSSSNYNISGFTKLQREMQDQGFNIRSHTNLKRQANQYLLINKINFISLLCIFIFMVLETAGIYLYLQPVINIEINYYGYVLILLALFPLFGTLNYVFYPYKKTKKRYYIRNPIISSLMIFMVSVLGIVSLALLFNVDTKNYSEVMLKMIIPGIYAFNFILYSIIWGCVYKSKRCLI